MINGSVLLFIDMVEHIVLTDLIKHLYSQSPEDVSVNGYRHAVFKCFSLKSWQCVHKSRRWPSLTLLSSLEGIFGLQIPNNMNDLWTHSADSIKFKLFVNVKCWVL